MGTCVSNNLPWQRRASRVRPLTVKVLLWSCFKLGLFCIAIIRVLIIVIVVITTAHAHRGIHSRRNSLDCSASRGRRLAFGRHIWRWRSRWLFQVDPSMRGVQGRCVEATKTTMRQMTAPSLGNSVPRDSRQGPRGLLQLGAMELRN